MTKSFPLLGPIAIILSMITISCWSQPIHTCPKALLIEHYLQSNITRYRFHAWSIRYPLKKQLLIDKLIPNSFTLNSVYFPNGYGNVDCYYGGMISGCHSMNCGVTVTLKNHLYSAMPHHDHQWFHPRRNRPALLCLTGGVHGTSQKCSFILLSQHH